MCTLLTYRLTRLVLQDHIGVENKDPNPDNSLLGNNSYISELVSSEK